MELLRGLNDATLLPLLARMLVVGAFVGRGYHRREAIIGVCLDRNAWAAATPLPKITGYPTSRSTSSTPAKAPSNCSCTHSAPGIQEVKNASCQHVATKFEPEILYKIFRLKRGILATAIHLIHIA